MDAATINAKIYAGRAKAALRLGYQFTICRPDQTINPLVNQIGALPASFSPDGTYLKPGVFGKLVWQADLDGSQVQVGDYLTAQDGPDQYFIAGLQSLLPIVVVKCNAALRLTRTVSTGNQVGNIGYQGQSDAWSAAIDQFGQKAPFIGWPCAMTVGKGAERFTNALPSSPRTMPGWEIMLPVSIPTAVLLGDRLMDVSGRIFSVMQAELSELGWRVIASEVHA